MRSNFLTQLSLGILALCLCLKFAVEVKAQSPWKEGVVYNVAVLKVTHGGVEKSYVQSDDHVFESFEEAFLAPEKVRRLSLKKFDPEMRHLPARLGTLVNLEELEMSCLEKLEDLPVEIGKLRKLESLIIDNGNGCGMNISIPRSIGGLVNLKVLTLYGALDPRDIGAEQPTRKVKIKTLPPTIANLQNLEELNLGRNGLRVVPAQIASLHKLKKLELDYNNLRELPASIGNLKNLQELSLRSNGGVKLPQSLAALKRLKVYMGNNSLTLREQKKLRESFPKIVLFFNNEFDDEAANEEAAKLKARRGRKR